MNVFQNQELINELKFKTNNIASWCVANKNA